MSCQQPQVYQKCEGNVALPHLSLQHVSSLGARWPVLCAVGAPDR